MLRATAERKKYKRERERERNCSKRIFERKWGLKEDVVQDDLCEDCWRGHGVELGQATGQVLLCKSCSFWCIQIEITYLCTLCWQRKTMPGKLGWQQMDSLTSRPVNRVVETCHRTTLHQHRVDRQWQHIHWWSSISPAELMPETQHKIYIGQTRVTSRHP